ncbi:MAG: DNA/RNA nuclease SfsA [Bacteroidales bacterium]|nr:DNA/RNA nuclease SfsA [Bacteroidales bacterium]
MNFRKELIHGRLVKRYKRFLADVTLDDGTEVTAHCTNSGTMKSCLEEGAEVWLSPVNDPKRKTRFTWEMIRIGDDWVGINTSNPNTLAFEWVSVGMVPGLEGLTGLKREVKWEDSRFDLYGEEIVEGSGEGSGRGCFIEVKNVTLKEGDRALFPDAVTERGRKHLNTLVRVKNSGMRAVMLYVVQRMDVRIFSPAREIDPAYGKALDEAVRHGVEVIVVQAQVSPESIEFHRMLPVEL